MKWIFDVVTSIVCAMSIIMVTQGLLSPGMRGQFPFCCSAEKASEAEPWSLRKEVGIDTSPLSGSCASPACISTLISFTTNISLMRTLKLRELK